MKIENKQKFNRKNFYAIFGVALLFLPMSVAYACRYEVRGNMQGSAQQMLAPINITQVLPGSNVTSQTIADRTSLLCGGRTQLVMGSAFNTPTWRRHYSAADLRTAVGKATIYITSPGSPPMQETYDLVNGNTSDLRREMVVKTNGLYHFHVSVLAGDAVIVSANRLESVPPADSNVLVRIVSLGGPGSTGGSDLRISSGIWPIINYCLPSHTSTRVVGGSNIDFGTFNAGQESRAYNRTKSFTIEARLHSRCDEPVTPSVGFSFVNVETGGGLSANQRVIEFDNGLMLQLKQSNGSRPGREVNLQNRTKHEFSTIRPSQNTQTGSLRFDAVISKRAGMPVTSGRFKAVIRYHMEYR